MPDRTRTATPAGPAVTGSVADPAVTTDGPDLVGLTPLARQVADRYVLGDEIARGGIGVVYRATDAVLGREVAVKVLQERFAPASGTARRFADEGRITGQLQHPGIPPVHDLGTLPDGRPFLAMKLIKGQTLEAIVASGGREPPDSVAHQGAHAPRSPRIDAPNLVAVFEAICQAVAYAHAHHVIHRDLKPANVMVGAFGEVQVMDWGLAKVLASGGRQPPVDDPEATTDGGTEILSLRDSDGSFTQAGSVLGTPAFMPPEQAVGAVGKVDERSDVFGLGGILAVILTGQPPFAASSAETTRVKAATGDVADCFARLDACGADPELVALCKRCLAPKPAGRPADAGAVAAEVARLRTDADERARRAERDKLAAEVRRRAVTRAAGVVAAVLLLGVAGTTVGLIRADRARRDAETARNAEAEQKTAAETARAEAEANEAEANATVQFFEDRVFAAARPKGFNGGLGKDATLRDAIIAALPTLADGFKDQPLVEARLRRVLGVTFRNLGDDKASAEQLEWALAIFTARRGPDHPYTLGSANSLANSYGNLGRHDEALKLFEATLAARQRTLPQGHPDTLDSMENLANSYGDMGRHADAIKLNGDVLAARRRVLPPDHPDILLTMGNMAVDHARLGRHDAAVNLYQEALTASRTVLPQDHPDTLRLIHNLADSYAGLGRHAEALKLYDEALDGELRVYPPDHPTTLLTMRGLAGSYSAVGRHTDAVKLGEEVLAAHRRVYPPDHPQTLQSLYSLAASYPAVRRYADALRLDEEATAGRKKVLGPYHIDTLRSLTNLASSYRRVGRPADALRTTDEFLANAKRGEAHPDWVGRVCEGRLRHFQTAADPAGCRASAEKWEGFGFARPDDLYNAACYRAVAARLYARAEQPAEATADADRAMDWLTKAVAAGFRDRGHIEEDADLRALRGRADFGKLVEPLPYTAPPPRPGKR